MKANLTRGLPKDHKAEIRKEFRSCSVLRKRIREILNDKLQARFKVMQNVKSYEGEWAAQQASDLGYCKAMNELISLLEDDKKPYEVNPIGRPPSKSLEILK